MAKFLIALTLLVLPLTAQANNIYKCIKDDKIIFSQTSCPKEFRQHEITYQLGIATEIDSDEQQKIIDPLQSLLSKEAVSQEKLLQLIGSEIYRLKQENSYYDILRASEKQKIDRKRYWQKKPKDDPEFLSQLEEMNLYFDGLIKLNLDSIELLKQHRVQIQAESISDEVAKPADKVQ
ncbi:DUF4124 domain-containing protein [Shewanella sp. Isolate11]|uniref:DUF4124 domain-containing protein n=1 Tax=Shewanella sp. Isolate11 TaxID=2908530 RepID=UPI001EFCCEC0|nr:DUF4124 domain-containing protein [Shewanella sp. Isolate11]MCG9695679.1 DUF4124 domain-containing protein [Shewanella sp. Isolate11]